MEKVFYKLASMGLCSIACSSTVLAAEKPNIVIFLADDLGYGSVSCYAESREMVRTPNIDRLAQSGVKYMNAYTTASVSSPTRYSLLTGNYPFRSGLTSGVVNPFGSLQLDPQKATVADMLKEQGYATASIGKWHHGYGSLNKMDETYKAYTKSLTPGALDVGFDYHFGMPQNHDDAWGVYIENDMIYGLKSDKICPQSRNSYGQAYVGFDAPHRNNFEVMEFMSHKAIDWIKSLDRDKPFFLSYNFVAVHNPITPSDHVKGTSDCGAYGDFIHDIDLRVGELLTILDYLGELDNTIVIFTSDNGGDFPNKEGQPQRNAMEAGLKINGDLRGDKHTYFEGGVRVPFIVSGVEGMMTGGSSDAIVSMTDIYATLADLLGVTLNGASAGVAADSHSFAPTLYKKNAKIERNDMLIRNVEGVLAYREGDWKFIDNELPESVKGDRREALQKKYPTKYLFNLKSDPQESVNLIDKNPELAAQMEDKLDKVRMSEYTVKVN